MIITRKEEEDILNFKLKFNVQCRPRSESFRSSTIFILKEVPFCAGIV